jgi:hypothetical protein
VWWRTSGGNPAPSFDSARQVTVTPGGSGCEPPPRKSRMVRSEASDSTSGCKSRRRKSPCGAVVISGSCSGRPDGWKPGSKSPRRPSKAQVGSVQGASNQEGRSQSERSNRRNSSPHEADSRMFGDAKVFHHLPDGQCRDRRMGKHVSGLPAELKAAILESWIAKARKVWRPGRMTLRMPMTRSITSLAGK